MADVAFDSDPVSFDEVKELHTKMVQSEAPKPAAPGNGTSSAACKQKNGASAPAQRPVMASTDIDRMLDALGSDEAYRWIPTYSRSPAGVAAAHTPRPTHPASRASSPFVGGVATDEGDSGGGGDDASGVEDRLKEVQDTLSGVETTISTIDDTTVDVKERVVQIERDMDTIRERVEAIQEDLATIKEQSLAVHAAREEVKALHREFRVHVKHHGTLMKLLLEPGALGRALGIQLDVAATADDASKDDEPRES